MHCTYEWIVASLLVEPTIEFPKNSIPIWGLNPLIFSHLRQTSVLKSLMRGPKLKDTLLFEYQSHYTLQKVKPWWIGGRSQRHFCYRKNWDPFYLAGEEKIGSYSQEDVWIFVSSRVRVNGLIVCAGKCFFYKTYFHIGQSFIVISVGII